jgi:hypothetical protein
MWKETRSFLNVVLFGSFLDSPAVIAKTGKLYFVPTERRKCKEVEGAE